MTSRGVAALRRAVAAEVRSEKRCAKLLQSFASVLLPRGSRVFEAESEVNTRRGRCDLIIYAREYYEGDDEKLVAYVWELKAPQCNAFCPDGLDRAKPSEHLYGAENQLIHYVKSLRSDHEWQKQHDIGSETDIRIGGIVIGREDTWCGQGGTLKQVRLARRAMAIREEFFYANQPFVLSWTNVLRAIENLAPSGKQMFVSKTNRRNPGTELAAPPANKALQRTGFARR